MKSLFSSTQFKGCALSLLSIYMVGCGAGSKGGATASSGSSINTDSLVSWSYSQEENGPGANTFNAANRPGVSRLTVFLADRTQKDSGGNLYSNSVQLCFDNHFLADAAGNPFLCQLANLAVQNVVGFNYAVPITDFDLFLDKTNYSSLSLTSASVITGRVTFNASTGAFTADSIYTKDLVNNTVKPCDTTQENCGASCDPRKGNAAGATYFASDQRIITGLYIGAEAPKLGANLFQPAYVKAAKVQHRALVQTLKGSKVGFDFSPPLSQSPVSVWFGGYSAQVAAESDPGMTGSELKIHFGLSDAEKRTVARGSEHVLLGWCVNGTKSHTSSGTLPMVLRSITERSKPKLRL